MEQQNCVEKITIRESITLRQDQPVMSPDLRKELQENSERFQPTETHDDAVARNYFWSIEGDFIYRRHTRTSSSLPRAERRIIPNSTEVS